MEYVETMFADTGATGGTDLVMAAPAAVYDGALMFMQIAARGGSGVTIPTPTGWSLLRNVNNGTEVRQATFYRFASGEPADYTITLSTAQQAVGAISMWSGVRVLDVASIGGTGTSTSPLAGGITALNANELVLAAYAHGSGDAAGDVYGPLPPPTLSEVYQLQSPAAVDTDRVAMALYSTILPSPAATGNKTAIASVSAAWFAHQIGFAPLTLETDPTLRHTYFGQRRNP